MNSRILCLILPMLATLPACTSFSHTNIKQAESTSTAIITKATFHVNPNRGRDDTLMILAFSGGGSRAAYWAASVMFKLQQVFASEGIDMLAEVDAISSVSGGSLPAAYYAISTDPDTPRLHGRIWEEKTVKDLMTRNYISRWIGNWFWPVNIGKFWFTAYDRTDIMAQTFADNLYDTLPLGRDLKIRDLNPDRPYLILNATDGTQEEFGSPFTFTAEDFKRIQSDINDYDLARAVMGSATFPAVFNYMTLKVYEKSSKSGKDQFRHVFDGGNADNLGLGSVRKILRELDEKGIQYDKLIVILVDAYAKSGGVSKDSADTRKFFDFIVDMNFIDATDSLLTGSRAHTLNSFCGFLKNHRFNKETETLNNHFIFYPIQFEDVNDSLLRQNLNDISTNFKISKEDTSHIDEAANQLLTPSNTCLLAIKSLLKGKPHEIDLFCHYGASPRTPPKVCIGDKFLLSSLAGYPTLERGIKLQILNGPLNQMPKFFLSLMVFAAIQISACSSRSPCDPDFIHPTHPSPPNECQVDGCSLAPDFDFAYCCNQHDARYWSGGTAKERKQADLALRRCLIEADHTTLAELYYYGVRIGGNPYLPTPWRWGFGWNYPQYQPNRDAESH